MLLSRSPLDVLACQLGFVKYIVKPLYEPFLKFIGDVDRDHGVSSSRAPRGLESVEKSISSLIRVNRELWVQLESEVDAGIFPSAAFGVTGLDALNQVLVGLGETTPKAYAMVSCHRSLLASLSHYGLMFSSCRAVRNLILAFVW